MKALKKAVANAPVPVTADMNIKVLVNLKLQPRRHTDTLIFTTIHLMYLMIHFLCRKVKKSNSIWKVFSNLTFIFFFYRYCNYKKIRWRYTGSAVLELKVPVFKTVVKLQTNSLAVATDNTFFRTPSTRTWTTNKSDDGIPVTRF